ncbi:23 kDa integral membrane protein-like [Trichoplusia ni]|uniref:Tetraspanin n=1 Tax=Trichoplusia ni TaxID=7111 RepID=A0A7E5WRV2_TRINI|nr:23 kDa integral membrane protein-like [Trichoplusia ni]
MLNFVEISKGCAKVLLLVFNILCILIALCTFGFAVVDIRVLRQYSEEQATGTVTGDVIILAASLLLIGVATLGCVGAGRENVKMLYLYVGFVMIMVILELLIAIYVSVQRFGLQFRVTDWIREDFYRNVTAEEQDQHDDLWNELQITYECCGLNGPEDYVALGHQITLSCCPRAYNARTENARKLLYKSCVESMTYYKDGCEEEILDILRSDADWLLGVAVISFWFEAASIVLAMWVSSHLKNSVQVYRHTVKY